MNDAQFKVFSRIYRVTLLMRFCTGDAGLLYVREFDTQGEVDAPGINFAKPEF